MSLYENRMRAAIIYSGAGHILWFHFSLNYLYLFYLYIFPIRSGNVLINFLRTFAEAFYTQGFIYTKKLPKLTLASTCLCLNNRKKTISIWKECCCDNEGHHHHFCQAFFAHYQLQNSKACFSIFLYLVRYWLMLFSGFIWIMES